MNFEFFDNYLFFQNFNFHSHNPLSHFLMNKRNHNETWRTARQVLRLHGVVSSPVAAGWPGLAGHSLE